MCLTSAGCNKPATVPDPSDPPVPTTARPSAPSWLTEITAEAGFPPVISYTTDDKYFMPEIMGAGLAVLDFDLNGQLDVFVVNGHPSAPNGRPIHDCLYRHENRNEWRDVSEAAGISEMEFGMGTAVGDIDNDGFPDMYVTNYGPDCLWHNNGDGTFSNITQLAGTANSRWATAATFLDYDRDGNLDLCVVNYLDYFAEGRCEDAGGRRDYCGPMDFEPTVDKLYHNTGHHASPEQPIFVDTTVTSGLAAVPGKGLGMICRDFTGDGRPDIFVANDMESNRFWIQSDDGTFREEALLRGVAFNRLGQAEANMGTVVDDFNHDGAFDLFITHLSGETNTLYRDHARGQFIDGTAAAGLGTASLPFTGFGVATADLELDGDLDLLIVNGRVKRGVPLPDADISAFWNDYVEPNQIFMNDGSGRFREDAALGGRFTRLLEVSRGLATADWDDDGDLDLLITNVGGQIRLFRNDAPTQGNWLKLRLVGRDCTRDAVGAIVTVHCEKHTLVRELNPSSGYLTSNAPDLHFGLGSATLCDTVEVCWPDGAREQFSRIPANTRQVLQQGRGQRVEEADLR